MPEAGICRADSGETLTGRAEARSDKVIQLIKFTLYDDNALGLSLRGTTLSTNLHTMVKPEILTALKPESVGMPPGVAMLTPTVDNEVKGYANIVYNSSLHPGANMTGRVKAGDVAPAPTIMATKQQGSQTRLLSHNGNRRARRTYRAYTRDMTLGGNINDEDQSRVTSQSDMKITPPETGIHAVVPAEVLLHGEA